MSTRVFPDWPVGGKLVSRAEKSTATKAKIGRLDNSCLEEGFSKRSIIFRGPLLSK